MQELEVQGASSRPIFMRRGAGYATVLQNQMRRRASNKHPAHYLAMATAVFALTSLAIARDDGALDVRSRSRRRLEALRHSGKLSLWIGGARGGEGLALSDGETALVSEIYAPTGTPNGRAVLAVPLMPPADVAAFKAETFGPGIEPDA